eukprot:129332_1
MGNSQSSINDEIASTFPTEISDEQTVKILNEWITRIRGELDRDYELYKDLGAWVQEYKQIDKQLKQIQKRLSVLQTPKNNTDSELEELLQSANQIDEKYISLNFELIYNSKIVTWQTDENTFNIIPGGQAWEESEEKQVNANDDDEKFTPVIDDDEKEYAKTVEELDKCFARIKKIYKTKGIKPKHPLIVLKKFPYPQNLCFNTSIRLRFNKPLQFVTVSADERQEIRDDYLQYGMEHIELAKKYGGRWGREIAQTNWRITIMKNLKIRVEIWIPYKKNIDGSILCPLCEKTCKQKPLHLCHQLKTGINCCLSSSIQKRITNQRYYYKKHRHSKTNYKILVLNSDKKLKTYKFHMIPHKKCLEAIFHYVCIKMFWRGKFDPQTVLWLNGYTQSKVSPDELCKSVGKIDGKDVWTVILFNEATYHFPYEQQKKEVTDYKVVAKQYNKKIILFLISCWGWKNKLNKRYEAFFKPDINIGYTWTNSSITGVNFSSFGQGIGTIHYVLDGLFNNNNEFTLEYFADKFEDETVVLKFGYKAQVNYLRKKDIYLDKYYGKNLLENWSSDLISCKKK